jgi:SAM-dependent methyltransferase
MRRVVCSLFVFAVFLAGCAGKQANPVPAYLPVDENPSRTAIEVDLGHVNTVEVKEQLKEEVKENRTPDVIYVATPHDVVDRMLELAQVTKDDLLYDLGCGDGRIPVTAAKRYGCRAVGYDIDPERVKESLENVEKSAVGHLVTIEQKDIFTLDLSEASVITLYLLPRLNVKLIPQLEKLKPGSRIVSHDFRMRGVTPDEVVKLDSNYDHTQHKIYLWTLPLRKTEKENQAPSAGSAEG